MSKIDLYKGDCLEVMDELIARGIIVDAIITDVPYQTTACDWDFLIPFNNHIMLPKSKRSKKLNPIYRDEYILQELKNGREYNEICDYFDKNSKEGMWQKLNKLIKPNGAIVLFGSDPFSSALRMSNIKNYKYDWVWDKVTGTGHLVALHKPMQRVEDIMIFNAKNVYTPIKEGISESSLKKKLAKLSKKGSYTNNNQQLTNKRKELSIKDRNIDNYKSNYPSNIIQISKYSSECNNRNRLHPTQKPVALMEYLIKTYTNEGELVLDFTAGSGTTAIASQNTNRSCIAIEMDDKYFYIMTNRVAENKNRIEETRVEKTLFDT